jgi:hypothetical protein
VVLRDQSAEKSSIKVPLYNISIGVFFSVSVLNTATMKEDKENALDFN